MTQPQNQIAGASFDKISLGVVCMGGAVGGCLHPAAAGLGIIKGEVAWQLFAFMPLLGVLAAGVSVFVLANSKLEDKLRLLFFSAVCGLTFPAVLAQATEASDPKSKTAKLEARKVANSAGQDANAVESVPATVTILNDNPNGTISPEATQVVQAAANAVVTNLALDARKDPGIAPIDELMRIGLAARASGNQDVTLKVSKELDSLRSLPGLNDKAEEALGSVLGTESEADQQVSPSPVAPKK